MADTTETVVFEINVDSYEKSLADLTKSINGLKDAQSKLASEAKAGNEQSAKSLEKVNAQIKIEQQEYRTMQNVLVGYNSAKQKEVTVTDFSKNSIQANRDLLKQLTAQYINTVAPTQKFTDQIKKLSDELKKQEGAIGDTRRNVGNYFNEFAKGVPVLGQAISGVKNMGLAFESAGGGVKGFSLALATTGLPLIISGVTALINVFKEFGGIADTIEQITEGIKGGFTAFVSGGSALEAGKQIASLTADLQGLNEEAERSVLVTEQTNAAIKRLQVAARDRTKSEEERLGLLKKADDLAYDLWKKNYDRLTKQALKEEEVFAKKHNLTEQEVRLAIFSNDVIKKQYDYLNDAQIDKLRESVGIKVKLDGEEVKKLIEGRVKLEQESNAYTDIVDKNAIREAKIGEDLQAKKDKDATEEKARLEKLRLAHEVYNKNLEALTTEFTLSEKEKLAKSFDDKIKTITGNSQKERDLIFIIEQDKEAALEKFDSDAAKKQKQIADEKLKIQQKLAMDILAIEEGKYMALAKVQDEANQKTADNALKAQQSMEQQITQSVISVVNAISGVLSSVSALINQNAQDAVMSLENMAGDSIVQQKRVEAESKAIKEKAWKQSKAIAITQAVMNTANAVMAQISNPTPYVGFVLAALAAVTGGIQIAMIAKQKMPKFKQGGYKEIPIGGKSHEDGGTPIHVNGQQVAEAERGEGLFIMKKNAYQNIDMLSGWNQKYGGNSWKARTSYAADGGMLNIPTSDGGFSTREIRNGVDNALVMENAIRNGFKNAPAPELSIVELSSKTRSRNRSVNISEL